jgi:hypothetical protein
LIRLCGDGRCQTRRKWGHFLHGTKKHPSCTQNRAVPTHHRTPDAPRWRSRLALDVGEGQKQTRCIDSPVRRRAVSNEAKMGSLYTGQTNTPPAHRTGLFRPTTALPTPPVGVPASSWVWVNAGSKLGALIRLCGDGAVSNEAKLGSFFTRKKEAPLLHTEPGSSDPPPHSRRPPLAFPPRPGCG